MRSAGGSLVKFHTLTYLNLASLLVTSPRKRRESGRLSQSDHSTQYLYMGHHHLSYTCHPPPPPQTHPAFPPFNPCMPTADSVSMSPSIILVLIAACFCPQLAPATGGFVLGQLVGSLYEKEAHRQGPGKTCYGSRCFRCAACILGPASLFPTQVPCVEKAGQSFCLKAD